MCGLCRTLVEAAERMELSYRQAKRLWKRYRKHGAAGLVHRSAGRSSNRAKRKKFRARVLRLIRAQYSGEPGERIGPTLAPEHLASEEGIELSAGTRRRWMLAAGLVRRRYREIRAAPHVQIAGNLPAADCSCHRAVRVLQ
ncbi:MAG TPA: helix-turn-helix domain-containing protein [Bryobacteraceae bacterium]|nr:helix-turn-helix domain-containing protein [Bryobacteraceae bacterium]